jgi:cytochrome c
MRRTVLAVVAVLGACATAAAVDEQTALERRGEALLTKNCASCHAIGRSGASTHPQAPAFRTLGKRYPVESLEETLAEGIISGHPDMPEFTFEAPDVGAIITYLESIQEP